MTVEGECGRAERRGGEKGRKEKVGRGLRSAVGSRFEPRRREGSAHVFFSCCCFSSLEIYLSISREILLESAFKRSVFPRRKPLQNETRILPPLALPSPRFESIVRAKEDHKDPQEGLTTNTTIAKKEKRSERRKQNRTQKQRKRDSPNDEGRKVKTETRHQDNC